jgi:hypothetical protein
VTLLFAVWLWCATLAPTRSHIEMATAITAAALEAPPLFRDDPERIRTAALMVAVAFRESSLRNDAIGDHGRALCAFQLWDTPRSVLTDPEQCARIALARLRESIHACGAGNELGIYAAGPRGCVSEHAKRISADRMHIAKKLAKGAP